MNISKIVRSAKCGVLGALVAMGMSAVAEPTVTVGEVTTGDPWSKVTVSYTLSGVDTSADYKVAFDVTADGVTKTVTDDKAKKSNMSYTKTIDTVALFGAAKRDAKAKVKVSLIEVKPVDVQLWEGGPYFAECNIGASAPEECGYYFWWGDTVGYKQKNASGNEWVSVKDGSSFEFSPSNSKIVTCNKSIADLYNKGNGYIDANSESGKLKPAYDAARAHLGAPWRMMTKAELDKLVDSTYCTWTWVTSYNGKSVYGYVVKGAQDPYKNNEVFFPATGLVEGSRLYNVMEGRYWSSTPKSGSSYAWHLYFNSSKPPSAKSNCGRHCGLTVRPVR